MKTRPMRWFTLVLGWLMVCLTGCSGAMGASAAKSADYGVASETRAAPMEPGMRGGMAEEAMMAQAAPPPPPAPPPAPPSDIAPDEVPPTTDTPPAPPEAKKIKPLLIYTANYTLAVFETTEKIDAVQKLATDLEGYLVRRDDTSITVRVPSEKYREALVTVGKLGDVLHREETVEDVTDQFMDIMTRLENARAVRDRLQKLLEQSQDVKSALEVERELARLTEKIEVMEGRLKRLRELVAFSTITVRFEARPTERVKSNVRLPFPWLDRLGLSNLLDL